nr:hypothetical protein [Tanacetum cinerariifolium]
MMVDDLLSKRIGYATRTALKCYTKEFEKKAQEERKLYIYVVEKSVKDIIKDEVKSLLPQILPKEVSDFSTPVIHSTINEFFENVVLAKSSSQPKSTYEAATSLTDFELKKDELYKFCDGTLTSVRNVVHDIANNLRMEYLPKRKWSNLDRKRSCIMIKAIDQQLFERRLMRNL